MVLKYCWMWLSYLIVVNWCWYSFGDTVISLMDITIYDICHYVTGWYFVFRICSLSWILCYDLALNQLAVLQTSVLSHPGSIHQALTGTAPNQPPGVLDGGQWSTVCSRLSFFSIAFVPLTLAMLAAQKAPVTTTSLRALDTFQACLPVHRNQRKNREAKKKREEKKNLSGESPGGASF